ncbi:hypothetical protein GNP79_19215 [Aliivibrio fischeri]|uniref:Uncharacterized protein n=1 Tax=Aliivibrio fischeri TaxID=668 RepID=A0A6N3ZBD6_ALIFS|nr:hypothetical protein [Aliivibrio fischeri]MUK47565.1 hypothetical protein [Aliivibrio fischeri]MUK82914.1 hypothetical protein [Aliivibrio fischeri]MUK86757.1 hypothetical protein [Aliivibrio fischeri]
MSIKDILINDRSVSEFSHAFHSELAEIITLLEETETVFENNFILRDNHRCKYVQEFTFMAIESVVSATRLLIEGHVNSSGNTMRIAYESLCMAILLSSDCSIVINKGKSPKTINFYKSYLEKHGKTKPYLAVDHVINNAEVLGLNSGKCWLKGAKEFYNTYSHSSLISMGSLILSSGNSIVGGGYHEEKIKLYTDNLEFIARFLRQLPCLVEAIGNRNLTKQSTRC